MLFLAAAAATLPKATPIEVNSWFTAEDYPIEAQKKGIEGTAVFEVEVDTAGKPSACRIVRSSGSSILDQKTCDIVLLRARFKPAMRHGKAVPGRFSKPTTWRLEGIGGAASGYLADIIDFTKDPAHPTCSVINNGLAGSPGCEEALRKFGSQGTAHNLAKVVALMSFTTGGDQPYRGDPAWGERVGFVAIDLYPPKIPGGKSGCIVVAKEGVDAVENPCAAYADASGMSDAERKDRRKAHIEQSLLVVQQRQSPTAGKCKNGESAAEVHGCG
jgi:TonB family protein